MSHITDTSRQDPALHLIGAMEDGRTGRPQGSFIEDMEARGQQQLVHSDLLPTDLGLDGDKAKFEALGFTFGDVVADDPLFQHATLPDGWTRQASDHAMMSHLLDERGVKRVSVFYKAAFYDRKAHMDFINVGRGFASDFIYGEGPVDRDLLAEFTADELADVRAEVADYLALVEEHPDIYGSRRQRTDELAEALDG